LAWLRLLRLALARLGWLGCGLAWLQLREPWLGCGLLRLGLVVAWLGCGLALVWLGLISCGMD